MKEPESIMEMSKWILGEIIPKEMLLSAIKANPLPLEDYEGRLLIRLVDEQKLTTERVSDQTQHSRNLPALKFLF